MAETLKKRAPIAVSIIAYNAEKTIGACVDSIRPHVEQIVVSVDERTTDQTAAVALKHGAKVVSGLVVSEEHECPAHGKVLAQHFARARDAAWSHLDPAIPWGMWIDADDVVVGAENLLELVEKCPSDTAGLWFPYWYSKTPNGKPATQFDRERVVRRSVGFHWQHRVHEVLVPDQGHAEDLKWVRTDSVRVVHQDEGHDNERSAKRNILLLEIELEEGGNVSWCEQYLGNQYFAVGKWEEAILHYRRSYDTDNVYQKWVCKLYESMAWEKLEALDESAECAWHALKLKPQHPEPYLRLAALCMWRGAVEDCEAWTRIAETRVPPPPFVFTNPLDLPFNARVTLGQALFNAGEPAKAKNEWAAAYGIVPTESLEEGLAACDQLILGAREAESYLAVTKRHGDEDLARLYSEGFFPQSAWRFGRLRERVVPALISRRRGTQPRIVFWCGRSLEPWAPPKVNETGVGGSETAVIEIARRFARDGWTVDVYNEPDAYEGVHDGVGYWGLGRLRAEEKCEVLVSWRNPHAADLPIGRALSLLWCHDLNSGAGQAGDYARWDRVLGVSQWHADYLAQVYGIGNTAFVPNGIDLERFVGAELATVQRIPFQVAYGSSPDRGLESLLLLWPRIVKNEPSARLKVAYGWETFDRSIAHGATYLIPVKERIQKLLETTPNVDWLGRLPQDKLADLYRASSVWAYPTQFTEVSCITAMECMAAGCVPVTSGVGALPETIADGGLVVAGNPYSAPWVEFYTQCLRAVLHSPSDRESYRVKGLLRARSLTWDSAYLKWKEIVEPSKPRLALVEATL